MGWPETQRERDALDRHITGNYGEDQYDGCADSPSGEHESNRARFGDDLCIWCLEPFGERPDICGAPFDSTPEGDTYCLNAFPCKDHPVGGKG